MKMRYFPMMMAALLLAGCDLVSPDEIVNPNVDESTFLHSETPWKPG